ncbi:hypothetical protein E2C01_088271 [Portunus trituberculatus]|uniref:Uncharacterized protein n=1 Tax=Portunus trituberculatus TaxID=210409 RepID=A0A5B7JE09_PORTR|nr:hypothetical protein [Portunus trituberculatus]
MVVQKFRLIHYSASVQFDSVRFDLNFVSYSTLLDSLRFGSALLA